MWPELFKDAFGILLPFSLHYRASLDDAVTLLDFKGGESKIQTRTCLWGKAWLFFFGILHA